MVPSSLSDVLESAEYEDNGGIVITSTFLHDPDKVCIQIDVDPGDQGPPQTWKISMTDLREVTLRSFQCFNLAFFDKHPLLYTHHQDRAQLSFSDNPIDPDTFLVQLRKLTRTHFESWRDDSEFLNSCMEPSILIRSNMGLLAEGPIDYLEEVARLLHDHRSRPSITCRRRPKFWNSSCWIEEAPDLKVMILDRNFFVARTFEMEKVDQSTESRAFGTSGISAAEQPRMPEASGMR